jgi:hypothetical protein
VKEVIAGDVSFLFYLYSAGFRKVCFLPEPWFLHRNNRFISTDFCSPFIWRIHFIQAISNIGTRCRYFPINWTIWLYQL